MRPLSRVKMYQNPVCQNPLKVLIKELQSLALDVKILSEDNQEIEIKETEEDIVETAKELGLDIQIDEKGKTTCST